MSARAEQSASDETQLLRRYGILHVRAPNPGPLTLSGTNTWVVARDPAWVVDPGPRLDEHLERMRAAIESRGGLGGVALTHDHHDHIDATTALLERFPSARLAGARGAVDIRLEEGLRFGPFQAVATPGHSVDHFAFVGAGACFTGDAVLGEGSVFITPYRGALNGYLRSLARLREREDFDVLCPGHGPLVWNAAAKLDEYLAHRGEREERLLAALAEGRRTVPELLHSVWSDVPAQLLPFATVTLAAHLDKLEEEHRLPEDVERPRLQTGEGEGER